MRLVTGLSVPDRAHRLPPRARLGRFLLRARLAKPAVLFRLQAPLHRRAAKFPLPGPPSRPEVLCRLPPRASARRTRRVLVPAR